MITGQEILGTVNNYSGNMWPLNSTMWGSSWNYNMMGGGFMWVFLAFFVVIALGLWFYSSFAYMEIAKKLRYKNPWLAWIPFARGAMILQLGGFDWGWIFLSAPAIVLLPLLKSVWYNGFGVALGALAGIAFAAAVALAVLFYMSNWRIFERRRYSGWLALIPLAGMVIPYLYAASVVAFLIALGFVAWQDRRRKTNSGRSSRR